MILFEPKNINTKMNREILFRGKRKDVNIWIYGNYRFDWVDNAHFIEIWFSTSVDPEDGSSDLVSEWIEVIPETVGQYTGFTDAGKAKLHEDDVIENDGVLLHISFCDDTGTWYATEIHGDKDGFQLCEFAHSKETWLQGNIHDNPELLTAVQ